MLVSIAKNDEPAIPHCGHTHISTSISFVSRAATYTLCSCRGMYLVCLCRSPLAFCACRACSTSHAAGKGALAATRRW